MDLSADAKTSLGGSIFLKVDDGAVVFINGCAALPSSLLIARLNAATFACVMCALRLPVMMGA